MGLLLAVAPEGHAETFDVGGTRLLIAAPEGLCALDPNDPGDALVTTPDEFQLFGRSKGLLQFASCDELEGWRSEGVETIQHYGAVVLALELVGLAAQPRHSFLKELETITERLDWEAFEGEHNVKSGTLGEWRVSNTRSLGRSDEAVLIGMIATMNANEADQSLAAVVGITSLRRIPVCIIWTRPMASTAFERLQADLRPYLAALVRQNP